MLVWLGIVVVVVFLAYKAVRVQQTFKEYPIPGPTPIPILGNVLDIAAADSFMVLASGWLDKYGNIVQSFVLSRRLIIIGKHPEAVKDVYSHSAYIKGVVQKDFESLMGKSGMIFSDGEIWSRMRKSCTGAFHKDYLHLFEDPMHMCATALTDKLTKNLSKKGKINTLDLDDYFVKVTLDVLGRTMLSTDFQALTSSVAEIPENVDIWLKETVAKTQNPFRFLTAPLAFFAHRRSVTYLRNFVREFVEQRIKARSANNAEHKDLLDLLLAAQDPDSGTVLTKEEVQDQVLTFIIAGHETTAHTLAYAVSSIYRYPQVLEKIREELDQVLGDKTAPLPGYEQCTKLVYLGAVIKETLRMHPIVPIIARQLQEDHKVAGYDLKAGHAFFGPKSHGFSWRFGVQGRALESELS